MPVRSNEDQRETGAEAAGPVRLAVHVRQDRRTGDAERRPGKHEPEMDGGERLHDRIIDALSDLQKQNTGHDLKNLPPR